MPDGYPSQAQSALGGLLAGIGQGALGQQQFMREQQLKQAYWDALAQKEQTQLEAQQAMEAQRAERAAQAQQENRAFQMMMQQQREAAADRRLGRQLAAKGAQGAVKPGKTSIKDAAEVGDRVAKEIENGIKGFFIAKDAGLYKPTLANQATHYAVWSPSTTGGSPLAGLVTAHVKPEAFLARNLHTNMYLAIAQMMGGGARSTDMLRKEFKRELPVYGGGEPQSEASFLGTLTVVPASFQGKINQAILEGNYDAAKAYADNARRIMGKYKGVVIGGTDLSTLADNLYIPQSPNEAKADDAKWNQERIELQGMDERDIVAGAKHLIKQPSVGAGIGGTFQMPPAPTAPAAQPTDWTANQPWSPKQTLGGGLGVTQQGAAPFDRQTALRIKAASSHPNFGANPDAVNILKQAQQFYPSDFQ